MGRTYFRLDHTRSGEIECCKWFSREVLASTDKHQPAAARTSFAIFYFVTRDTWRHPATCVMGSFMTSTSVTVPNWPKYSRSRSWLVCHDSPPTNSFPGAESELGVLRPLDSPCRSYSVKYFSFVSNIFKVSSISVVDVWNILEVFRGQNILK